MTNDQDGFTDGLRRAARALDQPPDPPREAIWARIDARRRARRPRTLTSIADRRWSGPGLAAALALGIAIGRLALPQAAAPGPDPSTATGAATGQPEVPFRLAATHHLVRTEALLTTFPIEAREGRAPQVARWAYDLLLDTRMLMDSPAGADPRLAALLVDLELILAQLATLRQDDAASELELIQAGIQQNDVIARLRSETSVHGTDGI